MPLGASPCKRHSNYDRKVNFKLKCTLLLLIVMTVMLEA
jgi:hypothetical protein